MTEPEDYSTEDLIKTGVRDCVILQQQNPNAISDGIDPRKAFEIEKPALDLSSMDSDKMKSVIQSTAELHVFPDDENKNVSHERSGNDTEVAPDPSGKPSHPDLQMLQPDGNVGGDGEGDDGGADEGDEEGPGPGLGAMKKKRKKKAKSKRAAKAGSGFEEYYVDPPMTPAQHEEEKGLYDMSRPFAERIETAIQRYVAKRNLDPDRKNLFDKYLTFGGVDGGPRMFSGGLDKETVAQSTAAEIAAMTATHSVAYDKAEPSNGKYEIDFEGCLRGFLSTRLPGAFEVITQDHINRHIGVIRNFMNYLLHHDVCPDYRDQIEISRKLCDQAQCELWQIAQVQTLLPSTFNMACSEIFGGTFQGMLNPENEAWMNEKDKQEFSLGINPQRARQVFKIGFAAYATDQQITKYKSEMKGQQFSIINSQDISLVVTETILGSSLPEVQALYNSDQAKGVPLLGKLRTKTWQNPAALDEDLTEEEEVELATNPLPVKDFEFWVEDEVLDKVFVGMSFQATVKQLSFGPYFFDAFHSISPSFFTFLPNEMMLGWREIEKEWLLPRPGDNDDHCSNELGGGDDEKPGDSMGVNHSLKEEASIAATNGAQR